MVLYSYLALSWVTLWHKGFFGRPESCQGHTEGWERVLGWLAGRGLPKRRGDIACGSGCIAFQSGAKQRLLVPECGTQTGPANAQGFRHVANRSAFTRS